MDIKIKHNKVILEISHDEFNSLINFYPEPGKLKYTLRQEESGRREFPTNLVILASRDK